MGACVSVHRDGKIQKRQVKRSQSFRTRFAGVPPDEGHSNDANVRGNPFERKTLAKLMEDREILHRISLASNEDRFYDAEGRLGSDSDEEFASVLGDFSSAGNSLSLPQSAPTTPRPTFSALREGMMRMESSTSIDKARRSCDEEDSSREKMREDGDRKNTVVNKKQNILESSTTPRHSSVSVAPVSDGSTELAKYEQQPKSEFEGCLPCLLNTVVSFDKRSPHQQQAHNAHRKKPFRLFSFNNNKRRPSVDLTEILDSQSVIYRPLAGTQVPFSDDMQEGSWSIVDPSSFKLRARNYIKDRKKLPASVISAYEPVGLDVFLSPKKIDHIARFVDLSHLSQPGLITGKLPALLIFNIQVPMYPASMFAVGENNGEGINLVFYYKLSETFQREGPPYVKEMLMKLVDDESEKVRGLVGESNVAFRERLKIVSRVLNPEEIHLSAAERKLVVAYNEKPVLSRPQHLFYKGTNYFEVDLDVHRFNFIARKAVESFRERLKLCILDIGLTIQGNKAEELPEYILCCARLNKLNIGKFNHLNTEQED